VLCRMRCKQLLQDIRDGRLAQASVDRAEVSVWMDAGERWPRS
jgi:hypothetical protein